MGEKRDNRIDQELVRALSHPIRLEILETLQGRVASTLEISEEIGQSVGVVSYHAGTLVRYGYLELIHSKGNRGAIENFFGITPHCFFSRPG